MSTPVPSLPTPLPTVEVSAGQSKAAAHVVLSRTSDSDGGPRFGSGGAEFTDDWASSVDLTGKAGEVRPAPVGSG
ncbi:MAG: peptidase M17, partial [Actinomycetota bacterium]|nr:peptidase M17 [Actinomycetota bacterium]